MTCRKCQQISQKPFQTQIVYEFDQYNLHTGIGNYISVLDFCFPPIRYQRTGRCLSECSSTFVSGKYDTYCRSENLKIFKLKTPENFGEMKSHEIFLFSY